MQGGRLRHKVSIWKYTEAQDGYGQPIKEYKKLGDAWAEIRPLLGTESFNDKMVHTEHTHKILMRYNKLYTAEVDATMQIRYLDNVRGRIRVFEIHGDPSNYMERDFQLQFNVKEVFDHDVSHPIPT